jgi:hypothetical protein
MKTTTAVHINKGLVPKELYDQVLMTCSHIALLTFTEGYSEGLTKSQQRAINKAWKVLSTIMSEVSDNNDDDDDPFI